MTVTMDNLEARCIACITKKKTEKSDWEVETIIESTRTMPNFIVFKRTKNDRMRILDIHKASLAILEGDDVTMLVAGEERRADPSTIARRMKIAMQKERMTPAEMTRAMRIVKDLAKTEAPGLDTIWTMHATCVLTDTQSDRAILEEISVASSSSSYPIAQQYDNYLEAMRASLAQSTY